MSSLFFHFNNDLFLQFFDKRIKKHRVILWNQTSILQKGVCKVYWELCSVFSCFGHCNWAWIMSWWRWILERKKKRERFLFTREPFTKTSLSFATAIKVWNIQFNLCSLFFRDFKNLIFSCFSVHFAGKILIYWRWIFRNQERCLSIMEPFTKTSISFYTGFTKWEIWKLIWHLFSRNLPYLPGIRFAIFSQLVELVS